jgi:SAM-dependent methyltransferase
MELPAVCHICGVSTRGEIFTLAHGVSSDCKPSSEPVLLFECESCGTAQSLVDDGWHRRAAAIYDSYESYAPAGGEEQKVPVDAGFQSRSRALLHWLAGQGSFVPERGRLLEIGCGRGAFLRMFAEFFPRWEFEGIERDCRSLESLERVPGFQKLHTGPPENIQGQFGFFAMVHALEHFENPVRLLSLLRSKATPGALLLAQVPDVFENPFALAIADHATHFGAESLERVSRAAGWEPVCRIEGVVPKELTLLARAAEPRQWTESRLHGSLRSRIEWLAEVGKSVRDLSESSTNFGLFGTAVAATWLAPFAGKHLRFFVDEDIHRIGRMHLGIPILAPQDAPADSDVFLGMAPAVASRLAAKFRHLPARHHAPAPLPKP